MAMLANFLSILFFLITYFLSTIPASSTSKLNSKIIRLLYKIVAIVDTKNLIIRQIIIIVKLLD
jgi:uncharacterized membrane protein YozB (DUF420 family)